MSKPSMSSAMTIKSLQDLTKDIENVLDVCIAQPGVQVKVVDWSMSVHKVDKQRSENS